MSEQLTRDQVLAMEPGKELDWLIARWMGVDEKLFNWGYEAGNHNYSTDISAAWEAMIRTGMRVEINGHHHTGWSVELFSLDNKRFAFEEWEISVAVCKAVLLAVMDL